MEIEKKKWVAAKNQYKSSIERVQRALTRHKDLTTEDLEVRKKILQDAFTNYNESVINLSALDVPAEKDDKTEYCYIDTLASIERHLKARVFGQVGVGCQMETLGSQFMAKLPHLDIPVFDGKDISNYKPFIEMFRAVVHEDTRISHIQRLCFLKKYLKGERLHIIDSLPMVGESYEPALKLLKERYDNPALLINSHVTSLLDLPTLQRGTAQQLRDFVASVRQRTKALENLEQPVSEWNALLSCILVRKIDPLTIRLFHSDRDTTTEVVTVDELLKILEKRAAALEASPAVNDKVYKPVSKSVNLSTVNKAVKCLVCAKDHKLYKCLEFIGLKPNSRIEFIQTKKLCQICLNSHIQKCRYNFKCGICNSRKHSTLLHVPDDQPAPKAQTSECGELVSMHVAQSISNCVLLPTAKVIVVGADNKKHTVRALLDTASQTSFCSSAFAKQLGLPQHDLKKNIGTLGDVYHNNLNKGINIKIESTVRDFKMSVTCSIIHKITSKLPQKQVDFSNFIIPKNIALADKEFHIPGEISLLLASDVFFKIIQDGKIEGGPADPILLNTQLGYIVSSTSQTGTTSAIAMHTVVEPDLDHYVQISAQD